MTAELGTGAVVWDAGVRLAEYVVQKYQREDLADLHVLEMGAGVSGLPGLAAAMGGTSSLFKPGNVHEAHLQGDLF